MTQKNTPKVLVTGAVGQIGSELTMELRKRYGNSNIIAAGHHTQPDDALRTSGSFEIVDVTNRDEIERVVERHNIDTIYHLAAILSVVGEEKPQLAWNVNINGLYNILETARRHAVKRVFVPSSIAVFGPETPRNSAPQETVLRPTTIYGVTKVAGELLGNYYCERFGLEVRGLRYPGIISSETLPGGGTTDYAVEIFYAAIDKKHYTCFVREDTILPMMYMPDCIKASIKLMETDLSLLRHHCDYNLAGMSFSAHQLASEITKSISDFTCDYEPDFRQAIADSWPQRIDDSAARKEWGWQPSFDLPSMTIDMLQHLRSHH